MQGQKQWRGIHFASRWIEEIVCVVVIVIVVMTKGIAKKNVS
jgi:hypothetical protein